MASALCRQPSKWRHIERYPSPALYLAGDQVKILPAKMQKGYVGSIPPQCGRVDARQYFMYRRPSHEFVPGSSLPLQRKLHASESWDQTPRVQPRLWRGPSPRSGDLAFRSPLVALSFLKTAYSLSSSMPAFGVTFELNRLMVSQTFQLPHDKLRMQCAAGFDAF